MGDDRHYDVPSAVDERIRLIIREEYDRNPEAGHAELATVVKARIRQELSPDEFAQLCRELKDWNRRDQESAARN